MSVTDNLPTKVGQRVQDVFTDSRGWVRELGERIGVKVALVAWDAPELSLGEDDSVFPVDALRVVEVIQLDVDHFADPGRSPLVQQITHPEGEDITFRTTRYKFTNGAVAVGLDAARYELLKQSATGWDD
jgi:hypothetical protein